MKMLKIEKYWKTIALVTVVLLLNACTSMPNPYGQDKDASGNVKPIMIQEEVNSEELLNVSIKVFESGILPEDLEDQKGLSKEIRDSEARYIPIHLKYAIQRTGYWANVRVVPVESEGSEVLVKGKILESNGETISLNISVFDSLNNEWFSKDYSQTVRFEDRKNTEMQRKDNFQNIYNEISNDIIKYRQNLTLNDVEKIKQVSKIRFANYMAPDVYSAYIEKKEDKKYELKHLPSEDDPMMVRIDSIKARDDMFLDTVNNYYDLYYSDMWESYDNWRKYRSEEMAAIREIENKALTQKVLGAAAIIGAIALGASSNSDVANRTGVLRTVMVAGGAYAIHKGFQTSKESDMNKEALEELGDSFATEVEPMIVDVDGKTTKLSGSAEQQYAKWKGLLKEIYHNETGF